MMSSACTYNGFPNLPICGTPSEQTLFILTASSKAFFCRGDIFSLMFLKASFPSSPSAFTFLRRPLLTPLTTEPRDNNFSLLIFYKRKPSCENKKQGCCEIRNADPRRSNLGLIQQLLSQSSGLSWIPFGLSQTSQGFVEVLRGETG